MCRQVIVAALAVLAVTAACANAHPLPDPWRVTLPAGMQLLAEAPAHHIVLAADNGAEPSRAAPADSQVVEQVRIGLALNDLFDNERKEAGVNVDAEMVFRSPRALRGLGGARPFVFASLNASEDGANFAGAGLLWRVPIGRRWTVEPSIAYALHDGAIDSEDVGPDEERVLYGSRDLFRSALAVERRITERVGIQVFVAHYSHGQVLGDGRNQGSQQFGLRLAWRPGPSRAHGQVGPHEPLSFMRA